VFEFRRVLCLSKVRAEKDMSGGSVCDCRSLSFVERMREEDKKERLERQYLLFRQPLFHSAPHQKRDGQHQQCLPNNKSFPLQALLHLLIRDLAMKLPPLLPVDSLTPSSTRTPSF
jgi:hypothetical protein